MNVIMDADVIAYMAAAGASETPDIWGDGDGAAVVSQFQDACHRADELVDGWLEASECNVDEPKVRLAFSGPSANNFRRGVHPEYKHNRTGEKPEYYHEVVDYLKQHYGYLQYSNLEGDDILGMHMGEGWVAVSTDKDMRTVPGHFVRIRVDGNVNRYNSTEADANHFWMFQTLTGDTVDGYKGCPGCGPKGATACLPSVGASLSELWHAVVQRYEEAWRKPGPKKKFITGHPEDEALINARAARILRDGDYDFDTEEVHLWRP